MGAIKANTLKEGDTFMYATGYGEIPQRVTIERVLEPREWLDSGTVFFHYETDEYYGCIDGKIARDAIVTLV